MRGRTEGESTPRGLPEISMADEIKPGVNRSQTYSEGQMGTKRHLRRIERREWWLWTTAVIITLLLTAGILSFLPSVLRPGETGSVFDLRRAMWGLLGIVLLFDV